MNHPKKIAIGAPRLFVLAGSDSQSGLVKDHTQGLPVEGNNDFWRLISDDLAWSRCHISPSYFRQGNRFDFSLCSLILNLVSDVDLNPKTLRIAERITSEYGDRLLNDPRRVRLTRRDDVASALRGVSGLHVPKVLRLRNPTLPRLRKRMEAEAFLFPAIVRRTGTQTGRILGVFQKPEDLGDNFDAMKEEYYFTEYVDCRWSDGLYRKIRLFCIGGEVNFDHLFISDQRIVNSRTSRSGIMKYRDDLRAEERRYFDGEAAPILDQARRVMKEIADCIKLDFFGMDCSPGEDGKLVLFEANATMNIIALPTDPVFEYAERNSLPLHEEAMHRLILKRMKQFDPLKSK